MVERFCLNIPEPDMSDTLHPPGMFSINAPPYEVELKRSCRLTVKLELEAASEGRSLVIELGLVARQPHRIIKSGTSSTEAVPSTH